MTGIGRRAAFPLRRTPGRRKGAVALAVVLLVAACAGNPGPGESGYEWNLEGSYDADFVVAGVAYSGVVELATARGGAVTGAFQMTSPMPVEGTLEGALQEASWSFKATYERYGGCAGSIEGTGPVEQGGTSSAGTMEVYDTCSDEPLPGTFSFTLRP
jgi:hypothetical protein